MRRVDFWRESAGRSPRYSAMTSGMAAFSKALRYSNSTLGGVARRVHRRPLRSTDARPPRSRARARAPRNSRPAASPRLGASCGLRRRGRSHRRGGGRRQAPSGRGPAGSRCRGSPRATSHRSALPGIGRAAPIRSTAVAEQGPRTAGSSGASSISRTPARWRRCLMRRSSSGSRASRLRSVSSPISSNSSAEDLLRSSTGSATALPDFCPRLNTPMAQKATGAYDSGNPEGPKNHISIA